MLELFTLGQDRGYDQDDVHQNARALTGLTNDWTNHGSEPTSASSRPPRLRRQEDLRPRRPLELAGQRAGWRSLTATHPSFLVNKLWGYFVGAPIPAATRARELEQAYVSGGFEIRPIVEAILRHPLFYEGPRLVIPPVVWTAGLLRASRQTITTTAWAWIASASPARSCSSRRTSPAGITRSGSTPRAGPVACRRSTGDRQAGTDEGKSTHTAIHETNEEAYNHAIAFWGGPATLGPRRGTSCSVSAAGIAARPDPEVGESRSAHNSRMNALRVLIPMTTDWHDRMREQPPLNCCDSFTRSQAVRRVLASGERRSRANGIRACRSRPASGSTGGASSPAPPAAWRSSTARSASASPTGCSATASPARRHCSRSNSPILISLFLQGGIDSLSLLAPAGDPLYEKLRPTARGSARIGCAVARGSEPQLASLRRLDREPAQRRQGPVFPGIGYADEDMSHFTSRHYWEVGATSADINTGWIGRYIDIAGDSANPFQGLSLDGQMNPTIATAKNPVAAIDQPDNFAVWVNGVWGNAAEWTLETASAIGDKQRGWHDAAIKQVASAASEVGIVRRTLKPWSNLPNNSSDNTIRARSTARASPTPPAQTTTCRPGWQVWHR